MNNGRDVVVISGVRTAIGDFGGALKDFAPTDLGTRCVREALVRAKVAPEEVGHVVFGNVIHTETKDSTCRASAQSTAASRKKFRQ